MSKTVNLSAHRNTLAKRKRREVRQDFLDAAKSQLSGEIAGYAIVTWDQDWNGSAVWACNRTMPGDVMPEYVKRVIERCVGVNDIKNLLNPEKDDA